MNICENCGESDFFHYLIRRILGKCGLTLQTDPLYGVEC